MSISSSIQPQVKPKGNVAVMYSPLEYGTVKPMFPNFQLIDLSNLASLAFAKPMIKKVKVEKVEVIEKRVEELKPQKVEVQTVPPVRRRTPEDVIGWL